MTAQPTESQLRQEIIDLADAALLGELAPGQADRLYELICTDPRARQFYVEFIADSVRLQLARGQIQREAGVQEVPAPPTRSVCEKSTHHAPRDVSQAGSQHTSSTPRHSSDHVLQQPIAVETHTHHAERDGYYDAPREAPSPLRGSFVRTFAHSVREIVWHPIALVFLLGLFAAGIIVYKFSTAPTEQPIAVQPPAATPAEPAARIVSTIDAEWLGALRPGGDMLLPGQRLALTRGSAEVCFSREAKVIFDAPAEFEVVDGGTCRLSAGKLTAHCPPAAHGFKVHTPDGTVTDLGTEFGVYVRNEAAGVRLEEVGEEEQQPGSGPQFDNKQTPITEVHVFRGQVELAQSPAQEVPKSQIPNPKSQIVTAGQAVTISENKVQPLPAADPFKFALDKLAGQPRKVLLSEDFEAYDIGQHNTTIGPWVVQTGTRKGQGVSLDDLRQGLADGKAAGHPADASYYPAPPVGARNLVVASAVQNPRDTYPLLAREIDGRELAGNCQLLVEFDFGPGQSQPSLAFANEVGHAAGLEFWRNADAATPAIEWAWLRYYHVRILIGVKAGIPSEARVERSVWQGAEGWVRDGDYRTAVPKFDWTKPPKFVIFGYPAVTPATPGAVFRLDNIRIEVISEK